jgi:hypothetical protein
MSLKLVTYDRAERVLGERAKERHMNSVKLEHRGGRVGGDVCPERLCARERACVI